ncbi:MAG: type II toxin-antitoxin system VapB family antitoxin [Deltaproteobacteria bacterium]|nr:type II toxin-antitoxin system VapB family antitoxin [Deltaproteobacteria bacterium]
MKTTIDISNSLFKEARALAEKNSTTFRAVVESALRLFLGTQKRGRKVFKLKKHSINGKGLVEELAEGDWSKVRSKIYEGHGT